MDYKAKTIPPVPVLCIGLLLPKMVVSGLLDGKPIAGPMDIVLKSFEMCPKRIRGEDGLRFRNVTGFSTKSRPFEYFLTSDASLDFPLDDSLTAEMHLAQWPNRGGWQTGIKEMKISRVCSALSQHAGKIWENVLVEVFGEKILCPIPAKRTYFRNMSINTKYIRLREFLYGKWRADIVVLQGRKTKGCMRVFTDISPAVSEKINE